MRTGTVSDAGRRCVCVQLTPQAQRSPAVIVCVCIDTRFYLCVCVLTQDFICVCGGWWLSLSNRSQTASGKCPRCQNASQSDAADTIAKPGAVSELLTLLAVSSFSSVIF